MRSAQINRLLANLTAALLAFVFASGSPSQSANFVDPPVVASVNHVIDILMIARSAPVGAFNLAGSSPTGWYYTICPRPASGMTCPAGGPTVSPYGGARLALAPGDTLKIRFVNKLPSLSPASLERIADDPLLALNPTNLHTHGLIVAAVANTVAPPAIPVYGDFIFTSIFNPANGNPATDNPAAYSGLHAHGDVISTGVVDYKIQIPSNHPSGAFWFHPHMHGIALNQLSAGLSGIISIGRVGDYACRDELCAQPIPESHVRHLILKDMQVLVGNTPQFQEDPAFCANQPPGTPIGNGVCTGDPTAYAGGSWFFTLSGLQYPSIPIGSADGEIWRFTNASGSATYDLRLINDQTQKPMVLQLVSIDGVAVSFPTGATAGQVVQVGQNRFTVASCGVLKQSYSSVPVCATDFIMMPATRVEVHVAYRDANNAIGPAPAGLTATLRQIGINTGPGGDSWPAVNLANVSFPAGAPSVITNAVHVVKGAASLRTPTGLLAATNTGSMPAPLPQGCAALAAGHRRRIYFGNPNVPGGPEPGEDAAGNPIFGLGYEEIDENGVPVPGTFVDITRFDPGQLICLPLGLHQTPAVETWELYNLTTELHNFHIHQTKFRLIDTGAPTSSPLYVAASQPGLAEDTVPLPFAVPGPGSQPALNSDATSCLISDFKARRCRVTPIVVQIPFSKLGTFVYHCHILEHEDGGMMHAIRVVPSPN